MYIASRLKQIYLLQQSIEEPRFLSKLLLNAPLRKTVPLLFYLKDGSVFRSYGNVGKRKEGDCFATPFFRIEHIIDDQWVTLQLLKPCDDHMMPAADICHANRLEKTTFSVEMQIDLFGGLQILDPSLVD